MARLITGAGFAFVTGGIAAWSAAVADDRTANGAWPEVVADPVVQVLGELGVEVHAGGQVCQ